jgi:transcriptional regulator with XRE-family HTH domain
MKDIGRRLKYFRQKLGLSQLELSQRSNISQASIARIEAYKQKNLKTKTLERLAAALELSLSQLLEDDKGRTVFLRSSGNASCYEFGKIH